MSFFIIAFTVKCLPTSRRNSSRLSVVSHVALFSSIKSSLPNTRRICVATAFEFLAIVSSSSKLRSSLFPPGSPIIPVPPPVRMMTLCPSSRNLRNTNKPTRLPTWSESADGSMPRYTVRLGPSVIVSSFSAENWYAYPRSRNVSDNFAMPYLYHVAVPPLLPLPHLMLIHSKMVGEFVPNSFRNYFLDRLKIWTRRVHIFQLFFGFVFNGNLVQGDDIG